MASQQLQAIIHALRSNPEPPRTTEEWRSAWDAMTMPLPVPPDTTCTPVAAETSKCVWITTPDSSTSRVMLYFHGGAFCIGSPRNHLAMLAILAQRFGGRVLAVDYRLAPDHCFPAAHEDGRAAYRWLLDSGVDAKQVVIAGDSCGATLALATLLHARAAGLPMPAAAICLSPWIDMEQTGATMRTNAANDVFLRKEVLDYCSGLYLPGTDRRDPLVSPLHADLSGLPPLLVQIGGSEVLLSDALRLAEMAAGARVPMTLEICPDVHHDWHIWATEVPESLAALQRIALFVAAHTPAAA